VEVADTTRVAVFAQLGVAMYLPRETVLDTLRLVTADLRCGSVLAFDQAVDPTALNLVERWAHRCLAARVAALRASWRSNFRPAPGAGVSVCDPHQTTHRPVVAYYYHSTARVPPALTAIRERDVTLCNPFSRFCSSTRFENFSAVS
jgi:O-methyltransferase involved in polyketide biosynthesis